MKMISMMFILLITAFTTVASTSIFVPHYQIDDIEIAGKVLDNAGNPLIGATIVEKGTSNGTTTDLDGNYSLVVRDENAVLVISFIGFITKEIQVNNITNKSAFNITLEPDLAIMEEVVVTALGIKSKKKSLGFSTTNVSAESVQKGNESNIVNSLAGKVSGVQINSAASGLGGSTRTIIRGSSSLTGNNQPLYVVDGVPIDNSGFGSSTGNADAISSQRTDFGSGISDINPNNVESISVLKGPNAAALYGNRAANGVIIITTKKGSSREGIGVSYKISQMTNSVIESTLPQFQNEYGQGDGGAFASDADNDWGPKFDGRSFTYPTGLEGTFSAQPNNVRDFFRSGTQLTQTVAFEGGNETANFRFSFTDFKGNGIVPNSSLNKNTFNLRTGVNLSDKLSVDSKVTYFTQDAKNRAQMGWGSQNPLIPLFRMTRNDDISDFRNNKVDELGRSNDPTDTEAPGFNPFFIQNNISNKDIRNRITGFIKTTYELNDNLSAFVRVGTDILSQKIDRIVPSGGSVSRPRGLRSADRRGETETNADFLVTFNEKVTDNFNINLNAGGNYRFNKSEITQRTGEDFKIPTSTTFTNLETLFAGQDRRQRSAIYSLYFSGTVDYKEMIFLNGTGRNDWDSRLYTASGTTSDLSFFYPSVSLSLLGNEIFGIDSSFLSFSKVRLAWAEVGSGGQKDDQIFFSLGNTVGFNGLTTVTQRPVFDDPELKPESTKSFEVGLELKFFNNRLNTDFTYYNSTTSDQIVNAPVDASTGFNFIRTNIGEITNKGVEFLIGGRPIQSSNFFWDTSVNLARNVSTLDSFIEGSDSFLFTGRDNFSVKTKVGGDFGDIWGNNFVFNDGKMVVDGNGLPVASEEEQLLGNYTPDVAGGFSNTLGYKDLTLSFLISFQLGGEAINWTRNELADMGKIEASLEGREGMVLDAVVNTGTPEDPVFTANTTEANAQEYTSRLRGIPAASIVSLTNARLRELSIGYSLPSRWLDNTFTSAASISLIGRNLFFLSKNAVGIDPGSTLSVSNFGQGLFYYNLPTTRNFGFSLNVTF